MKVWELIKKLKEYNEDLDIMLADYNDEGYDYINVGAIYKDDIDIYYGDQYNSALIVEINR